MDNTETAFQQFENELDGWNGSYTRRVVLVHGNDGCGKSSLIHRCVHALAQSADNRKFNKTVFVDLLAEQPSSRTAEEKARQVMDLTIDHIRDLGDVLSEKDLTLIDDANTLEQKSSRLARAFRDKKRILVILIPAVEISKEVEQYVSSFAQANVVLFLESSVSSLLSHCSIHHGSNSRIPILPLEVGRINADDGVAYVNARVTLVEKSATIRFPRFPEAVMRMFISTRVNNSFGISIRELERACEYAYSRASERGDDEVQYIDLANYYVKNFQL